MRLPVYSVLGLFLLLLLSMSCRAQAPTAIIQFDKPFLFTYGTWDKKAQIENGLVRLEANGLTPKGGGGVNLAPPLDLLGDADDSPGLRVLVGPRNSLKTLKLMLTDTAGHSGTWSFSLPAPSLKTVLVTPLDAAPFAHPNEVGKTGIPDLSKIMQWQLLGDWGGDGPVAVRVEAIVAVAPDAALRTARAALVQKDAEAIAQARKDREEARVKYGRTTTLSPVVETVYAAAADVLALQIHSGKITPSHLSADTKQPGDTTRVDNGATILTRGGQDIGYLIGPKKDGLVTFEGFSGDPLLTAEADNPTNYTVRSTDDPAFAAGVQPLSVGRKSKPDDWQQPKRPGLTLLHRLYLQLPHPLTPGRTYTVSLANINVQTPTVTLAFDPAKVSYNSNNND